MIQARIAWASKGDMANGSEVSIVTDILRASTVITTLLAYGAEYVLPVVDVEEAFECAKKRNALLIGERNAVQINGFDFGNSPAALSRDAISGRAVVFSSTNFPKGCDAARASSRIYIGSFLNISQVTEQSYRYAHDENLDICFVLSGSSESDNEEDLAFAAISAGQMLNHDDITLDQNIINAFDWIRKIGIENAVSDSDHAKRLKRLGFTEDVCFAIQRDIFPVAPFFNDFGMIILSKLT